MRKTAAERKVLCVTGGCFNKRREGKTQCSDCALRGMVEKAERKAVGLCTRAGCRNEPVNGASWCDAHKQDHVRRYSEIREQVLAERKDAGLCICDGCPNDCRVGRALCQFHADKAAGRLRKLKQIVFNHYGQVCNCPCGCRVTKFAWLTIDHINNDGAEQRRNGQGLGSVLCGQIIRNGFPDNLQILCWNCNCAKEYYGGCS